VFGAILLAVCAAGAENPKENRDKALAGDPRSQFLMGLDASKDSLEDAYAWFRASASRGHYPAAFQLDCVNGALQRAGRLEQAKVRYGEISALIAGEPAEVTTFRRIEDAAVG
jgi:hypothetical protein